MELERVIKVKYVMISLFIMVCCQTYGQKSSYINPGLLSAYGTLSPAKMLNRSDVNYYLSGTFEGLITKHISIKGGLDYLLGNSNKKFLNNNIRFTIGMEYLFPFGNLDLHTGIQPGFSFMRSNRDAKHMELVPIIQLNFGVRYYIWKYFHFFVDLNYVHAEMQNLNKINGMADELILSAGLGLNLQVLKKYRNPK